LFDPDVSEVDACNTLNEWIKEWQSCLFGKIAARNGWISYCILTEADLQGSDERIRDKIQAARTIWTAKGFKGENSAFIVLAISRTIAYALPNAVMRELAQRLAYLYLLREIEPNCKYHDEIQLEKPGRQATTWSWLAGVNYFCAQGDKRWWQDHRIPGGMAFSVNSVGHMVKAGKLANAMMELEKALEAPPEGWDASNVDSLERALALAMATINNASDTISGKATELLPIPPDTKELPFPTCPIKLSSALSDKNFCEYLGYYHTDVTIPPEYFLPDVERPKDIEPKNLDFTYLFDDSIDNADYITMGEGRRVRADSAETGKTQSPSMDDKVYKRRKAVEEEVPIDSKKRLVEALRKLKD
jgi:hypothetical protein